MFYLNLLGLRAPRSRYAPAFEVDSSDHFAGLVITTPRGQSLSVGTFDRKVEAVVDYVTYSSIDELGRRKSIGTAGAGCDEASLLKRHVDVERATSIQGKLVFFSLSLGPVRCVKHIDLAGLVRGHTDHELAITEDVGVAGNTRLRIAEVHSDPCSFQSVLGE